MGKEKKKHSVLKTAAAACLLIAAAAVLIILFSGRYLASTMRLERMEGSVRLEDEKGNGQEPAGGMRFRSGNALCIGSSSLASVSLDSCIMMLTAQGQIQRILKKETEVHEYRTPYHI